MNRPREAALGVAAALIPVVGLPFLVSRSPAPSGGRPVGRPGLAVRPHRNRCPRRSGRGSSVMAITGDLPPGSGRRPTRQAICPVEGNGTGRRYCGVHAASAVRLVHRPLGGIQPVRTAAPERWGKLLPWGSSASGNGQAGRLELPTSVEYGTPRRVPGGDREQPPGGPDHPGGPPVARRVCIVPDDREGSRPFRRSSPIRPSSCVQPVLYPLAVVGMAGADSRRARHRTSSGRGSQWPESGAGMGHGDDDAGPQRPGRDVPGAAGACSLGRFCRPGEEDVSLECCRPFGRGDSRRVPREHIDHEDQREQPGTGKRQFCPDDVRSCERETGIDPDLRDYPETRRMAEKEFDPIRVQGIV